ncbi:MAG TPA: hypothetical protein VK081_04115, partial [Planctomycetota bacterium]|nr:hypothetical protein [Planctomycetota bacterium]
SLEPLSVALIALAAPGWADRTPRWALPALVALWGEGAWIILSGFVCSPGFSREVMSPAAWICTAGALAVTVLVVVMTARRLRRAPPPLLSSPQRVPATASAP